MDCSSTVLVSISVLFIVCTATLVQNTTNTTAEPPGCPEARVDCRTKVFVENQKIELEVSCDCKKRQDVIEFLEYLIPVKCSHLLDKPVDHSFLEIKNCDVAQKEFPPYFLKLLRRSKKLTVLVEDSQTLRIPSFYEEDGFEPVIETTITNSHVSGIGRGWFNMAKSLSMKVLNSSLGILEAGIFGNYKNETSVEILVENTNITLIKSDAFSLPINGRLTFKGGRIEQIEKHSIQGGKSVTIEAAMIASIQSEAFNIYGMKEFNLDSNIIARVEKMVIFQDSRRNRIDTTKMLDVEQVVIKGNKFSSLDGDAFVGLCGERNLIFENNFIDILTSPFRLESEHCPTLRKWKKSFRNNGFRCHLDKTCQDFDDNVRVNCMLHGTSWCPCGDLVDSADNVTGRNEIVKEKDNSPCRVPWIEIMKKNCADIDEGTFDECASIMNTDDGLRGRSLHFSSSSNVHEFPLITTFASVATAIYFI